MMKKVVGRDGLGDILADGVRMAAKRIGKGAEELAVHCAGQEPGMHDPKYFAGLSTSYQLDATPGRHGQGGSWMALYPDWWKESLGVEDLPVGAARQRYTGKGEVFKRAACMIHFINASGLCRFPWSYVGPASMWEYVSAVTGWHIDADEAYRIGERIANIRQCFNVREGFNALEHPLHPRMISHRPSGIGARDHIALDTDTLVNDFLRAMEWDTITAAPSTRKLIDLGLGDIASEFGSPNLTSVDPQGCDFADRARR